MAEDKRPTPKKEFFKNPRWWLTFIFLNLTIGSMRFMFFSKETFTLVFDILIGLSLILMLVEISHDKSFGDRFFDTLILSILIWLLLQIFELPATHNFLLI